MYTYMYMYINTNGDHEPYTVRDDGIEMVYNYTTDALGERREREEREDKSTELMVSEIIQQLGDQYDVKHITTLFWNAKCS